MNRYHQRIRTMSNSKGIGIIRIPPPNDDQDASKKAIQNIATLSSEIFDTTIVFDDISFDHERIHSYPMKKHHQKNPIKKIFSNLMFQIRLIIALFRHRNDIDVTFWHVGGYRLVLPMVIAKLTGKRIVFAVTGQPTKGFKNETSWGNWSMMLVRLSYIFERTAYHIGDRIVIFSEAMNDYDLLDGFENKIYEVSFNYQSIPEEQKMVLERDNIVVFLGRIIDLKGANTLADATELLAEEDNHPVDKVIFVGDGNLRPILEEQLAENPSTKNLVEFTEWVDHDEAMSILEQATVFALPSESEGLPKALQEAMARGVIPVVTPVGSIPDVVDDGTNGILLPDNEPETLANGIKMVLNGDQLSLSTAAKQTIEQKFSYETVSDQFETAVSFSDEED